MKIVNNQDKIADKINKMGIVGVEAVGDDGSVCVQVSGSKKHVQEVAKSIEAKRFDFNSKGEWVGVGDGVQSGEIWINSDENNIHGEVSEVGNSF